MIDIEKVKSKILTLAFQGKLIPFHITQENTALETLHSITKNYNPVSESEQLIETSDHWQWSRLGYVCNNHGQIVPDSSFCYIDVGSIDNKQHCLSSEEKIIEAKNAPSRARKIVYQNDVIYSTVRPYLHNICLIDRPFSKKPIASTAFCVLSANKDVLNNRFLYYWLLTTEFDRYSNGDPSKGALYPAIGEKDLLFGAIPIPPIEEQQEIVKKIDSSFALLNSIYDLQNKHFTNCVTLKSKLIDAAIQGKLTEQLPEDGTAEELYQQIQQEKRKLEAEGKIKKEKALPPVSEDEIPFDIPQNWKWCRLIDVGTTNIGLTYHPQDICSDGITVIRSSNIQNGKMDYSDIVKVKCDIRENQYLMKNDIVICARNGSKALVGKCAIYEGESYTESFGAFMAIFRTPIFRYLYFYFNTMAFRRYFSGDDSKQINQVTQNTLKESVFPLPPLAEQKRIVAKLEELLPLCE